MKNRDHLLTEAKSAISRQECKVVSLSTSIRVFQRQAHSDRSEMTMSIKGMKNLEESRPDYINNWLIENKHFDKLAFEISMKWKN